MMTRSSTLTQKSTSLREDGYLYIKTASSPDGGRLGLSETSGTKDGAGGWECIVACRPTMGVGALAAASTKASFHRVIRGLGALWPLSMAGMIRATREVLGSGPDGRDILSDRGVPVRLSSS